MRNSKINVKKEKNMKKLKKIKDTLFSYDGKYDKDYENKKSVFEKAYENLRNYLLKNWERIDRFADIEKDLGEEIITFKREFIIDARSFPIDGLIKIMREEKEKIMKFFEKSQDRDIEILLDEIMNDRDAFGALENTILFLSNRKFGLFLGGCINFGNYSVRKEEIEHLKEILKIVRDKIGDAFLARYILIKSGLCGRTKNSLNENPQLGGPKENPRSEGINYSNTNNENKDKKSFLSSYFDKNNFFFSDSHISSFYTALKTKGFVILAGLAGTGKTKMAQLFARGFLSPYLFVAHMGEQKNIFKDTPALFLWENTGIKPSNGKNIIDDIYIYPVYMLYFDGEKLRYVLKLRTGKVKSENVKTELKSENWKEVWVGDKIRIYGEGLKHWEDVADRVSKSSAVFIVDEVIEVEDEISKKEIIKDDNLRGGAQNLSIIDRNSANTGLLKNILKNEYGHYLFLSVRPDWRDNKPLMGFYNPITQRYVDTPLFNFILDAIINYKRKCKVPYFLILDEMNLSHVEYYFSDFLSVMESGRGEDGFTVEGIKIYIGKLDSNNEEILRKIEEAGISFKENGYIDLRLPPNFYVIGTVNVDETTYMFSPKVLDRAFTIEFNEVSLKKYKEQLLKNEGNDVYFNEKIKKDFTNNGEFLAVDYKKEVLEYLNEKQDVVNKLEELVKILEPYDLHFGYRVFDEIVVFLKNFENAEREGIIHSKNNNEALDLAVLMKVLPKFHGNVSKLKRPLWDILNWSIKNKENKKDEYNTENLYNWVVNEIKMIQDLHSSIGDATYKGDETEQENQREYIYPHTALKILRMLSKLLAEGFTSYM